VYQAILRTTGEKVAVKIRRPGIVKLFAADVWIIDFLFRIIEGLALMRPGLTTNFRRDFRNTMIEELDFRREARLQEIFRTRARANRRLKFSAQRVYFQYSNGEMIVQEFAAGIWLYEILDALQHRDADAQRRMQELGVDPRQVARNLMYANFWGMNETIAFHADPHPANIVVRPNNNLIFVDFGASGYIDHARRRLFQRGFEAQARADVWSMVQSALALCEPLPPVDVPVLARELELATYNYLVAVESKHAEWWERTTAALWTHTISVISRYGIPVPMDLLKFSRASLLYDTIAARLDPDLDIYDEYRRWARDAAGRARRRVLRGVRGRMRGGPTDIDFARLEQLAGVVGEGLYRLDRLFSTPVDFLQLPYTIEKSVFTLLVLLQFFLRASGLTLAIIVFALGVQWASSAPLDIRAALRDVVSHPAYLIGVAVLASVHLRVIMFRLGDRKRGY
jgi:predicted unusual protein kinase regulating ubiquinone biosynthesis (AarF/ABC1/UbiB family)